MPNTLQNFKPFKLLRLCAILFVLAQSSMAQTRGRLEVIKDPLIDTLIARRYTLAASGARVAGIAGYYGYRVQFFSGASRTDAYNAQHRLQQLYPDIRTYITYKEPNFKVKAGDFRTRLEASKLLQQLKGTFTTLFIISEKINPPRLDTNTIPQ